MKQNITIKHHPQFNTEEVCKTYSEKDGVDVKYVCTTDLVASDIPVDIFYRPTPHPEFGNRYFGLYYDHVRDATMITNATYVEHLTFGMIEHEGQYHYSQSHHDYNQITEGKMIDGGRVYIRSSLGTVVMKVKDGEFQLQEEKYYQPGGDCQQ